METNKRKQSVSHICLCEEAYLTNTRLALKAHVSSPLPFL